MSRPIIYSYVDSIGTLRMATQPVGHYSQHPFRVVYASRGHACFRDSMIGDGPPFYGTEAEAIAYLVEGKTP